MQVIRTLISNILPGGHSAGVPPDPIPNSVVKPGHADDTAWAAVWESRLLPGVITTLRVTAGWCVFSQFFSETFPLAST